MAKRKNKRLGSPPEMHRTSARDTMRNARSSLKWVRRDLARGLCASAIESLVSAAEFAGMAHAEASGARGQLVRRRPTAVRVIAQLTARVVAQCAKPKKKK